MKAFAAAKRYYPGRRSPYAFVNADPGLGKTHLVQAAGAACREYLPRKVAFTHILLRRNLLPLCKSGQKSRELEALKYNLCELDVLCWKIFISAAQKAMREMILAIIRDLEAKKGRIIFTSSLCSKSFRIWIPSFFHISARAFSP